MTTDERTPLRPQPVSKSFISGKTEDGDTTPQKFAVWQIGALVGIMLAYADTSLVWATQETIASWFDHLEHSSWMMTSFTIGNCVTLPLYGRLSDNYGRLHPLVAAYSTFCIGCTLWSVGTGLLRIHSALWHNMALCSQTYWQVILGRVVTGCGVSGIISLASIVITDVAAPSNVAVLRSFVNIASTVGLSLGGPLGGFLSGTIGWRWSFLAQVPIAIGCCVLITSSLKHALPERIKQHEQQLHESESLLRPHALPFDYIGAATLATGLSSILTVIDLLNRPSWKDSLVLGISAVGILSIICFLAVESFPGNRELLIPLSLFRTEVGAFCAGQLLIIASCHGFVAQTAPYFTNTRGASEAEGGGLIIPASIGNAIGNLLAGQMIKRTGSYKRLSIVSLFLLLATSVLILFQWSHPIGMWEALLTFPFGLFGGMVLSTQFIGLYFRTPKEQMATAISMYYMSQQIGIALGISIGSSLLKRQFQATLRRDLVSVPEYNSVSGRGYTVLVSFKETLLTHLGITYHKKNHD